MRAQDLIVVVTSVGTEEQALDIAHALVRSHRAACVNIVPNVHSIYRWKGRLCVDEASPAFASWIAKTTERDKKSSRPRARKAVRKKR